MATDWQRFHWDLDESLEAARPAPLSPFIIRQAEASEADTVLRVVSSALMMERAWTGSTGVAQDCKKRCEAALESDDPATVVVQHGSRIIGASVLDLVVDAEYHLLTGPCILHEYRSRGLGSALLHRSLEVLRENGLRRVVGIARVNSTVARYVYPKFGGVAEAGESPKAAA